jgi:ferredoxin
MDTAKEKPLWRLNKSDLGRVLEQLLRVPTRVIAPVERGGRRVFSSIRAPGEVVFAPGTTSQSPKEFVFPRTELLFRYQVSGEEVRLTDPAPSAERQVLFGLRPCDAAGLTRLDSVLLADPFYARRREQTTVVAWACSSCQPACFCTAVGGSLVGEEGADILLAEQGDAWIARVLTDKGADLIKGSRALWQAGFSGQWEHFVRQATQAADFVLRATIPSQSARVLEQCFESDAWEDTARRCIGCSICTYVCPSCSCFDLADEGTVWSGKRCRSWDSCSLALFTQHGSGHNPRATQAARFRQRVLHKFAYFPLRHGGVSMCVGCGRCVDQCPVGIDIHKQVVSVLQTAQETSHAQRG